MKSYALYTIKKIKNILYIFYIRLKKRLNNLIYIDIYSSITSYNFNKRKYFIIFLNNYNKRFEVKVIE